MSQTRSEAEAEQLAQEWFNMLEIIEDNCALFLPGPLDRYRCQHCGAITVKSIEEALEFHRRPEKP